MFLARAMLQHFVVGVYHGYPPSQHMFGVFEIHQPCQASMVRPDDELPIRQVVTEVLEELVHGQKFPMRCAVGPLCPGQGSTSLTYRSQMPALLLRQYCAYPEITGIRVQHERAVPVRVR